MEKEGNLIGDLYASITNYASVLVKTGKQTYYRKTTDLLAATASGSVVFLFAACVTVFAGLGLAFWLGEVMGSLRLGMFATAGIFLLLLVIFHFALRPLIEPRLKNTILRRLTGEMDDYSLLRQSEAALQSELKLAEMQLKQNIEELKAITAQLGGGAPGDSSGNGSSDLKTEGITGRLVGPALKFIVENYLLRGAGPVKRIVLPVVVKAVANSELFRNRNRNGFLEKLRMRLSKFI
jgi:hypothetical protein